MDIYDPISHALGVSPIDFPKNYLVSHAECYEHRAVKHAPSLIKGIPKSEEHKRNLSASQKGKVNSPESRAKMSAKGKGRVFTEEHKANLSAAMKGKSPSNKGKALSEEHRAKIRESWVRRKAKSGASRA